jgi:hypothetical protein
MPNGEMKRERGESYDGGVESALRDVWVLIKFLGRADDARLQSYFEDAGGVTKIAVLRPISPPCRRYGDFLNRLARIQSDLESKKPLSVDIAPTDGSSDGKSPKLSDVGFILWARDFLAAIAAPATADTIRMTTVFLEHRAVQPSIPQWLMKKMVHLCGIVRARDGTHSSEKAAEQQQDVPGTPPKPAPREKSARRGSMSPRIQGSGKKLAARVAWLNFWVFAMTIVTIFLSMYALSGHLIVTARDDTIKDVKSVDAKIFEIETHNANSALRTISDEYGPDDARKPIMSLCDSIKVEYQKSLQPTDIYNRSPSFGPIPNAAHYVYTSYNDIDVCRQRRRDQIQLFAVGEQLIAWQRVFSHIWIVGRFFGKSNEAVAEFSNNMLICANFTGNKNPDKSDETLDDSGQTKEVHKKCADGLGEIAEYYGRIPDAILGCITLYLLPCLYGFLGAGVATLRNLRIKVDANLVNLTERAAVWQSCLMGVVSGAVVGLFAAYLSKGGAVEGIGVSALAFLAGYNVTGLFALFDDISNRIFHSGTSAPK